MSGKSMVPTNIEALNRYVAGKTIAEVERQYRPKRIAKLASNENRWGFSPAVRAAIEHSIGELNNYPDPIARKLRSRIAGNLGVNEDEIIITAGSDSVLAGLFRTFFQPGQNAVTVDATFVGFFVHTGIHNIPLKKVPLNSDFGFDVSGILNAINEHTRLVYVASPNNPTGVHLPKSELEQLINEVPDDVLLVMDEAYFEFADGITDYSSALAYRKPNVIVLRTFSKAYGLAGLRIGYAIGDAVVIDYLMKTKMIFEPSALAQAGAVAAYGDIEFLQQGVASVRNGKERLYRFFDEKGVRYIKSASNSVLQLMESEAAAAEYARSMLEKGVILRHVKAFGVPNGIRITVGTEEDMAQFEEVFNEMTKA